MVALNPAKILALILCYQAPLLISGCGSAVPGGESKSNAKLVTLSELEDATKLRDRIAYLGHEGEFTYFYAEEQGYFRIKSGWTSLPPLAQDPKAQEGSEPVCYVRINDGKFVLATEKETR